MATKVCLLLLFSGCIRADDYVHHPVLYQSITDKGTYNFGYDTGLFGAHSSHKERKDDDGIVRGKYSYTDPNGKLRTVEYEAGPFGFRPRGDVGPERDPEQKLSVQQISGANDTTLQGEGSHHIQYDLRPPSIGVDRHVQAASSHPNREMKGYTYDAASHPDVSQRLYVPESSHPRQDVLAPAPDPAPIPDASSHPHRETKGYTYDQASHPDVRDRIYVPQPSHPRPQAQPHVPDPPAPIPDASSHPHRETKGYTYDQASHPDVRDRIYVPQPSHPRPQAQPRVPDPPAPIPAASSHPNRETKGYTYDQSSHPDVRDRTYVPQPSHPRPQAQPHVPDPPAPIAPAPIPAASSHPNRETKGYTYDRSSQPDVRDRTFVPQSSHPRPQAQPRAPDPPAPIPAASSHPNRETKGYTYDQSSHPDVRDRIYVPQPSHPRPQAQPRVPDPPAPIPAASSHPNRETKGYTYDPASHPDVRSRIYVPQSSYPRRTDLKPPSPPPSPIPSPPPPPPPAIRPSLPSPPRVPAASSHPNRETKGYTYDPASHPSVEGRLYVPYSSRQDLSRHKDGYVQDSSSDVHIPSHPAPPVSRPSQANELARPSSSHSRPGIIGVSRASSVSVARTQSRPVYTKSYVSGSSRSVSRVSSASSRSVKVTGFRKIPQYMSAEEYRRRYRGG